MKKYWKTQKYKSYNQKRAAKSLEERLRNKGSKKRINTQASETGAKSFKKYVRIVAPEEFTLIGNPENVISFINEIRECFDKRQKVFVIFRYIKRMDYDAIVVLLSIMVRFKALGIRFNGDFPDDVESKKILAESGFLKNLNRNFENEDEYVIKAGQRNIISTHGSKIVDSELGINLIETASTTVWGKPQRCQGVQTTLVELMQNTFNHADPSKEGERHWWLSVNHAAGENKMRFSFVDYGVGIFKSLANKPKESKFFGILDRMWERFHYGNNADLLRLILKGELHKTVTDEYYRGQGLPGILESLNENWFSNLHIISNNVHANVSQGEYDLLECDFNGTFIYWEIDPTNLHFDVGQ
jgi:hypothetical protein